MFDFYAYRHRALSTTRPIAINGRFLSRNPTGVERTAFQLTRHLAELLRPRRPRLTVFVPKGAQRPALEGVEYKEVGLLRGQLWEQLELPFFAAGYNLLNLCNLSPVLHSSSLLLIHDVQVRLVPSAYKRLFRWWYNIVQPLMARRARVVATVSTFSKQKLEEYGVVPDSRTIVVPNGCDHMSSLTVDDTVFRCCNIDPDAPYFLAIGSSSKIKNLRVLYKAMALLGPAAAPLIVVGDRKGKAFAAEESDASGRIKFVGRVSDEQMKALLSRAQALLFPSLTEGFGLPPLEAMTCGCPVIASDAPAIPEVCGQAPMYVDPLNAPAWAAAMSRVLADPSIREVMTSQGFRQASAYTWGRSAKVIASCFSDR